MPEAIIRALSEATIHQIAAGEVIERPANVVKELVENALDAGATRITVTCEEGGKSLIRVADNGKGMVLEDLRNCWLPHTTSKLRNLDDLEVVTTMGFRGEALCSMAAVSELTLETKTPEAEVGACLTVNEGREEGCREAARATGTTVSVRHLFLNNPVRRKFLGSARSESTRILNQITRLALARPDVGFRLLEGPKEVLNLREGTLKHRVGEVLGFHQVEELLPVHWSDGNIRVEGLVSTPQQARQRNTYQHFYVNGRSIFSPNLQRALTGSYDVLPPGHHPVAVLFLTLLPREIDVNIHPTKREIRFLHESRVHWAVSQAVTHALRLATGAPQLDLGPDPEGLVDARPEFGASSENAGHVGALALAPWTAENSIGSPSVFTPSPEPVLSAPAFRYDSEKAKASILSEAESLPQDGPRLFEFPSAQGRQGDVTDKLPGALPSNLSTLDAGSNVPYLQVHNRFILFAVSGGLMLVNQQAAHERVLYEKALEDMRRPGRFSSQQLLFPEIVELQPDEARMAEEHAASLLALGFDLEAFGGRTFQIRGLPSEVASERARKVLQAMLQDLLHGEAGRTKASEEMAQRLARAYARVTCIRLDEPLDGPRMAALMDALFATRNPYVSPTGAPVVIRFPLTELNRRFGL